MSSLIVLLIFIALKRNIKSAPIQKRTNGNENYQPNNSGSKNSNKTPTHNGEKANSRNRLSLSENNFQTIIYEYNGISGSFVTELINSNDSLGKMNETKNSLYQNEETNLEVFATNVSSIASSDEKGRNFIRELLTVLFIGTVCLAVILLSSWIFCTKARNFGKKTPDSENREPFSETPMRDSIIPDATAADPSVDAMEKLMKVFRKKSEVSFPMDDFNTTVSKSSAPFKDEQEKLEDLSAQCTQINRKKNDSFIMEHLPSLTKRNIEENQVGKLVYHVETEGDPNFVDTSIFTLKSKDVSTSTEDLPFLDKVVDIRSSKYPYRGSSEEDLDFLNYEIRNGLFRTISIQTDGHDPESLLRRVRFVEEVIVKHYLMNKTMPAFDKRNKRSKKFKVKEIVDVYPIKTQDGDGKYKKNMTKVESSVFIKSKPILRTSRSNSIVSPKRIIL